jgi:ankyrin repeat protein
MKAAQCGNIEMVKLFLLYPVDPRFKNQFGQTALTIVVSKNHQDVVDLLKQAGSRE